MRASPSRAGETSTGSRSREANVYGRRSNLFFAESFIGNTMLNLFQNGGKPASICAVPDGGTLPTFLRGDDWSFIGKVSDLEAHIGAADREAVAVTFEKAGYYLYEPAVAAA